MRAKILSISTGFPFFGASEFPLRRFFQYIADMDAAILSEMIFRRKSVRAYSSAIQPQDMLADVLAAAKTAVPLFPGMEISFRILRKAEIRCACTLSAQHYLAAYYDRSPDADLNCGFMLQQVDLWLSSRGLGSCWLGMARPVEESYEGRPAAVLLSFGVPAETPQRSGADQFRRKNLTEIAVPGAVPDYIESMRLAPSAMNKQPWFFSGDIRTCHAFSVRGKGFVNLAEGWRFFDLGIALAHLYIAATASCKTVSFRREDSVPSGNGNEYVISCRIADVPPGPVI
jgi:nitroreductase